MTFELGPQNPGPLVSPGSPGSGWWSLVVPIVWGFCGAANMGLHKWPWRDTAGPSKRWPFHWQALDMTHGQTVLVSTSH